MLEEDKNKLLSTALSDKMSEIGNLFFNYNRLLDAGMDYLDVDWNMNKLSDYIHKNLAHKAPLDADAFRDYNAQNSRRTNYGADILGNSAPYESPLGFFAGALTYCLLITNAVYSGIELAMAERNCSARVFLERQLPVLEKYKAQFVLLYDKCGTSINLGNTWQDVDNRWEDFVVPMGV
jgi:hypothetical protein